MIASISGSFGLTESIRHWGKIIGAFSRAKEILANKKPDILVLIDYPEFNIALAKKAKSFGIPTLYYVSPQVWAWRSGRIKKIASRVDRMAVLFPFEVDLYRTSGLPCEFVGHPVAETIDFGQSKDEIKKSLGIDHEKRVITLLPGSRSSELKRHWQLVINIAEKIHISFPGVQIIIPLAPGTEPAGDIPGYVKVLHGRTPEAVACSEVSAVASGTATLETALLGTPMVVFYRLSPLTVFLGKLLIKVKYISLVNLLLQREALLELIQKDATADKVFNEINKILTNREYRNNMIMDLKEIKNIMGKKTASLRVAAMVGEVAGWNSTNA
jgi:lipid-A-disaccharide synthase